MPPLSLEQRVAVLERELSELKGKRGNGHVKDWRRTVGMFTNNPGMKELFAEAMKLREVDRTKARQAAREEAAGGVVILLDMDHLSVLTDRRAAGNAALVRRLARAGEPPAIPIVTVEEQCKGWLAKLNRARDIHEQIIPYNRLAELFNFLAEWDVISLSEAAADLFAQLRGQRVRIGSQDLKIAAIAMSEDALLLSANLIDFQKVPGLRVENWLRG